MSWVSTPAALNQTNVNATVAAEFTEVTSGGAAFALTGTSSGSFVMTGSPTWIHYRIHDLIFAVGKGAWTASAAAGTIKIDLPILATTAPTGFGGAYIHEYTGVTLTGTEEMKLGFSGDNTAVFLFKCDPVVGTAAAGMVAAEFAAAGDISVTAVYRVNETL